MEQTTGKRLSELRKAKGLSVEEFAAKLGVKPSAVYGLQSDANKPSFDTLASIAHHFPDVRLDWLLTGSGPMLRDGRALTPLPKQEEPAAPRKDMSAVQESAEIIYLKQQLESERQQRQWMQTLIEQLVGQGATATKDLPGKWDDSDYAAAALNSIGFQQGKSKAAHATGDVKVLGNILPMQVDGALFIDTPEGLQRLDISSMRSVAITEPVLLKAAS